jgi:phosphate transport system substrate-binding protein
MRFRSSAVLALIMALTLAASPALARSLVIKGSTTVLPIAQKVAEAYMKEKPDVRISISGGGSGNGIKALIDGSTDIADSSRFIKEKEIKLAIQRGRYPVPFAVAYDCIVPIVHPSNDINNLSLAQLKSIYQGEIRNWQEIGGPKRKIVVVSRDTSSGTYEVWAKKVMQKGRVFPGASSSFLAIPLQGPMKSGPKRSCRKSASFPGHSCRPPTEPWLKRWQKTRMRSATSASAT